MKRTTQAMMLMLTALSAGAETLTISGASHTADATKSYEAVVVQKTGVVLVAGGGTLLLFR